MNFRTLIEKQRFERSVSYHDRLFFIGSCFAQSIGEKLAELKFGVTINPYCVSYNPFSVTEILDLVAKNTPTPDCFYAEQQGEWFSMLHGTNFSSEDRSTLKTELDNITEVAHNDFINCDKLFITLGTSWVYRHRLSGRVVNNCLKLSSSKFVRESLSVDQIVESFTKLFESNPIFASKDIVFTVSPIRHMKDGFVENTLSKSKLVVAIHILRERFGNISYFPSYEIMNDDLRDYRFYKSDMLHPSQEAVDYIFEHLCRWMMDLQAQKFCDDNRKLLLALQHRAFNPQSGAYVDFCRDTLKKIAVLEEKYRGISYLCENRFFGDKICLK